LRSTAASSAASAESSANSPSSHRPPPVVYSAAAADTGRVLRGRRRGASTCGANGQQTTNKAPDGPNRSPAWLRGLPRQFDFPAGRVGGFGVHGSTGGATGAGFGLGANLVVLEFLQQLPSVVWPYGCFSSPSRSRSTASYRTPVSGFGGHQIPPRGGQRPF
jgi:hypothetical protein